MVRWGLAVGLLFTLGGCMSLPPALSPGTIALDRTTLDERAAIAAENAYQAAGLAAIAARDAGLLDAADWKEVQRVDRQAYQLLLDVRRAYREGNGDGYTAALASVWSAIGRLLAAGKAKEISR